MCEEGIFLRTLGYTEECVFYYQTDVMGASCVKDDNRKIRVFSNKLMGV